MSDTYKPKIALFHCINCLPDQDLAAGLHDRGVEMSFVNMACSSMVKDVYLLRAFEAGADAVIVAVCADGQCRYVEGSVRAKKRVAWVQQLLDEIGLDGRRLLFFNLSAHGENGLAGIIQDAEKIVSDMGPSPAA